MLREHYQPMGFRGLGCARSLQRNSGQFSDDPRTLVNRSVAEIAFVVKRQLNQSPKDL
jgi:hypothetical protein